jgi:ATP-dependent HslUV protease subunit HslV
MLRNLEALLIVADKDVSLLISGNGDVIEPQDSIIAIGSGGSFAQSSAKALYENTDLCAEDIVKKSLHIASEICIYTNSNLTIEKINV